MTASIAALLLSVVAAAPCRGHHAPGVDKAQRARATHATLAPPAAAVGYGAVLARGHGTHNP